MCRSVERKFLEFLELLAQKCIYKNYICDLTIAGLCHGIYLKLLMLYKKRISLDNNIFKSSHRYFLHIFIIIRDTEN